MSESMWQCIKCGNMAVTHGVGSAKAPKPEATPCGRGGTHHCVNADSRVSVRWTCKKCGAITNSPRHPLITPCPRGSGHDWKQM
jgi:predicted nucleic-acid-binding Zn-ribbon protein